MPMCDDLPWDPGWSPAALRPTAVEQRTQVVYIVSRVVECVEPGEGSLERRLHQLHSLVQRDTERNQLDYHHAAAVDAAPGVRAAAAEQTPEAEGPRKLRHELHAEQDTCVAA